MSTRTLGRRVADLARRQAEAAERHAAEAATMDAGHAARVAFLRMVPEDLRLAVGVALADPARGEYLAEWACYPFARWAAIPAGFEFPRPLVEWLLNPPHPWFLGHSCERCGLGVPLLTARPGEPTPPCIAVFPTCPACGGPTSHAANGQTGPAP